MAGEKRRARLRALLKTAGVPELDTALVEPAFVHGSAAREQGVASNQRLEFFGDAILGFVASRWLMRAYPGATEGQLSRRKANVVSGAACAESARRLGFAELVVLGHGMTQNGGAENASILSDAFEAFIAALYAATDFETVARFVENEHVAAADKRDVGDGDAKTLLQEFSAATVRETPLYFDRAEGPPSDRRFTSQVRIGDEILGEGIGASKKAAQSSAASMALNALRQRYPQAPALRAAKDDGRVIALDNRRGGARSPRKPRPGAPT